MADDATRRFYRCRQTCCEMLETRGYILAGSEVNENYEQFVSRFQQAQSERSRMLLLGSLRSNEHTKILVYFSDETKKTGVKPVKDLIEKMEERNIQRAVLVAQNVLTAFAREIITEAAPKYIVEYFTESELLVNITKHELVPKHVPLTDAEKQALMKQYKIKDIQLPRILQTDPVARFLGLSRGQVVKIIRPSETAGILRAAKDQSILAELKSGESYSGTLVKLDIFMNLVLKDVVYTSASGEKFLKMPECILRGSSVKYVRLTESTMDSIRADLQAVRTTK